MDIHKPKAAHSWREFLIEIGTITCGILIALGLEQVVEQLHARHETEQLDKALRIEVTRNLGEAVQQAAMFYCLRSQTATAADRLSRPGDWPGATPLDPDRGGNVAGNAVFAVLAAPGAMTPPDGTPAPPEGFSPAGGVPAVLPSPRSTLIDRSWLSAASTPGLAHMDRKRRDRFALIYYTAGKLEAAIADMDSVKRDLTGLAYPQQLAPAERRRYLEVLAHFDNANRTVYSLTGSLVANAEHNGLRPDAKDVNERLDALRHTYGSCVKPFVMPRRSKAWAEKFENDRERFGGSGE